MPDEKKITAIKYKKRRGAELCEVHLDGRLWSALEAETIVREGLRTGTILSDERQIQILRADEVLRARRTAAIRTALKPRSKKELKHYLKERGFRSQAAGEAIEKLEENGIINDREVARRHLRKRLRQGGYGEARLRAELEALGLEHKLISEELAAALSESDSIDRCLAFAEKKSRQFEPISEASNRRRFIDLLRRRGFENDVIYRVLDRIGAENSSCS